MRVKNTTDKYALSPLASNTMVKQDFIDLDSDQNVLRNDLCSDQNKDITQIKGIPNSYLALDDIEYGFNKKIPLWLFGLMY